MVIIAIILALTLRCMDSTAPLNGHGYRLESLLAMHLDKGCIHWREAQYVNVWGSVHWKGVYSVGECKGCKFYKLANQKQPKVIL